MPDTARDLVKNGEHFILIFAIVAAAKSVGAHLASALRRVAIFAIEEARFMD